MWYLRGEGDDRGWDGWMASSTWWTWVWVSSGSWWWQGSLLCCSPWGCKESDLTERLNWTELIYIHRKRYKGICLLKCIYKDEEGDQGVWSRNWRWGRINLMTQFYSMRFRSFLAPSGSLTSGSILWSQGKCHQDMCMFPKNESLREKRE